MITIEKLTDRINERGIKVDIESLNAEINRMEKKMSTISSCLVFKVASALKLAESKVNLNSSKIMVDFFYGYHQLPITKLTKIGRTPALDSDTLSLFSSDNSDVREYIEYRSLSKNLYILKNIKKEVVYGDEIHTKFNCNGALSGRFTSQGPNLQQIPQEYRRIFIPRKGFSFLCIDLKQAEPTLAFALAGTPISEDIHTKVANQLSISREKAKIFNIGISYGMTAPGLAKVLGCSKSTAQSYIRAWQSANPELVSYTEKINAAAAESGQVKLYDGSIIYEGSFNNPTDEEYTSNRAFNIHIQGSLALLIKKAMVKIQDFLDEFSPNSHIVLTEHDELVIELSDNSLCLKDTIISMFENIDGFHFSSKHLIADCWEK